MQRGLLLSQPALGQDIAAALIKISQGLVQTIFAAALPIAGFHLLGGVGAVILQEELGCLPAAFIIGIRRRIKRHVSTRESALHAVHFFDIHTEFVRYCFGLVSTQPGQVLLGTAKVEEKLALCLGGGNFDDAPVAQNVLVHFRLDPVHGERYQTHALFGVEALHSFHQANIAFLNQVSFSQAITGITASNVHHKSQVGHDQLPRSREIVIKIQILPQLALTISTEYRNTADRLDICRQVGAGHHLVDGLQAFAHLSPSMLADHFSTLYIRVLIVEKFPIALGEV